MLPPFKVGLRCCPFKIPLLVLFLSAAVTLTRHFPFGFCVLFNFNSKNDIPFLLGQKSLEGGDLKPHMERAW